MTVRRTTNARASLIAVLVSVGLILALAGIAFQPGPRVVIASPAILAEAQASTYEAFMAIYQADIAGGSQTKVRELSSRLNKAVNMTREAYELEKQGRSAEASNLNEKVVGDCSELATQARLLREEALLGAFRQRLLSFTLAPILAFVTTVVAHFGYRWWKRWDVERTLRMEIHIEEKKE